PLSLAKRAELLNYLVHRLTRDWTPAFVTVRLSDRREQQAQVVVHLGHRAYSRSRAASRRLLFNGYRGRQAVDGIHVRFLELVEELPRVCRERFYIATLPFGIDGVKGEAGFAGAR